MYHLIVKYQDWQPGHDTIDASRVFEDTTAELKDRFKPNGVLDAAEIARIPAIFIQETRGDRKHQVAQIGRVLNAEISNRRVVFRYTVDATIPPISNDALQALGAALEIGRFSLTHTHWAVKDVDLHEVLFRQYVASAAQPTVFRLERNQRVEKDLIAAMMPFSKSFDGIYAGLRRLATRVEMRCQRADDIWKHAMIVHDIVDLIQRAAIVVCDCTGRNPNVFYEIGIAHSLGKEVVLITQRADDIPFDVRHLRYITYEDTTAGRRKLARALQDRINSLVHA